MNMKSDEHFSLEEAQKRFEAALRGARIAGAKRKAAPKKSKNVRKLEN
ncbi:hypothetical protein [Pseudorhodoplanes sp.]|nr:hypothetical protein [Pseudorhodoplanes sp.]HWV54398.1 hypothetical protein [Pseudorhodoplanes sp.]